MERVTFSVEFLDGTWGPTIGGQHTGYLDCVQRVDDVLPMFRHLFRIVNDHTGAVESDWPTADAAGEKDGMSYAKPRYECDRCHRETANAFLVGAELDLIGLGLRLDRVATVCTACHHALTSREQPQEKSS